MKIFTLDEGNMIRKDCMVVVNGRRGDRRVVMYFLYVYNESI